MLVVIKEKDCFKRAEREKSPELFFLKLQMAEEDKGKDPLTPPWDPEKKWENPPVGMEVKAIY